MNHNKLYVCENEDCARYFYEHDKPFDLHCPDCMGELTLFLSYLYYQPTERIN